MEVGPENVADFPSYPSRSNFCCDFPSDTALAHPFAPLPPSFCSTAMANYPLNPVPFLPPGFAVEPGPANRVVRSGMVVGPIPPSTTTTWQ